MNDELPQLNTSRDNSGTPANLDDYLSDLIRKTFGGDFATTDASAPIVLPDKEELTVRLVSQQSLERLRDAESDRWVYDNLLWCLMGAILGFFINLATDESFSIHASGYVLIGSIGSAIIVTLLMRRRLVKRLDQARRRVHVDNS
jgi:hypothetical protein